MFFMRGFDYYGICLLSLLFINLFFIQGVYADSATGFTEDQIEFGELGEDQSFSVWVIRAVNGI